MAYAAPEALAQALRLSGPPILKSKYVHGSTTEERLQLAPDAKHSADHDPHKEGRAVDIVLLSSSPSERAEAEELLRVFKAQVGVMQWGWLIYNKKQWSPLLAETPRIYRPMKPDETPGQYALDKVSWEHITHIHIEWTDGKKDLNGFYDTLVKALEADAAIGNIDSVGNMLAGFWDATIGNWTGVFKFTQGGTVTWANSRTAKPGGTGSWDLDTPGKLTWKFGGGDIRTFVVDLPLDVLTDVTVLPAGHGAFQMMKGGATA